MELFAENDLLELPVVDSRERRTVVGIFGRVKIASDYLQRVQGTDGGDPPVTPKFLVGAAAKSYR